MQVMVATWSEKCHNVAVVPTDRIAVLKARIVDAEDLPPEAAPFVNLFDAKSGQPLQSAGSNDDVLVADCNISEESQLQAVCLFADCCWSASHLLLCGCVHAELEFVGCAGVHSECCDMPFARPHSYVILS